MAKFRTHMMRLILHVVAALLLAAVAFGNELQDELSREWKNKIVILRAFPTENYIRFDSQGNPLQQLRPGYWTSDGMVRITNVSIRGGQLRLEGRRVINVFDQKKGVFANIDRKQDLEIRVNLDPSWQDSSAVRPLLEKVFLRNPNELLEIAPAYWSACLKGVHQGRNGWTCGPQRSTPATPPAKPLAADTEKRSSPTSPSQPASEPGQSSHEVVAPQSAAELKIGASMPPSAATEAAVTPEAEADPSAPQELELPPRNETDIGKAGPPDKSRGGAFRVGKGVMAPKPLYTPDPEYTEAARQARTDGATLLWVVIGERGEPKDVRIARPLGAGLDDVAVETIRTWRFSPATFNGRPVPVMVNIEVRFHLR